MLFDFDGMRVLFFFLFGCLEIVDSNLVAELRVDVFERPLAGFGEEKVDDRNVNRRRDCQNYGIVSLELSIRSDSRSPKKNFHLMLFSAIGPATRRIICAANWLNIPTAVPCPRVSVGKTSPISED